MTAESLSKVYVDLGGLAGRKRSPLQVFEFKVGCFLLTTYRFDLMMFAQQIELYQCLKIYTIRTKKARQGVEAAGECIT